MAEGLRPGPPPFKRRGHGVAVSRVGECCVQEYRTNAKSVLVIAQYIAPLNAVAAIRWTKLAKYLTRNFGYKIDVITNVDDLLKDKKGPYPSVKDSLLLKDRSCFNNYYDISIPFLVYALENVRYMAKAFLNKNGNEDIKKKNPTNDPQDTYKLREKAVELYGDLYLKAQCQKPPSNIDYSQYDVIISTYGPLWTHVMAGQLKNRFPHLIWIADFRDNPARGCSPRLLNSTSKYSVYAPLADCVLAVSDGELSGIRSRAGQVRRVLTNGYDPDEIRGRRRLRRDVFAITCTGSIYGQFGQLEGRSDLRPLFWACEQLIARGLVDRESLEIHYAGREAGEFDRQIHDYPNLRRVVHGHVERKEALRLQDEASLLVLPVWNTDAQQGIMSGRVYEYMASGVPIVCVCSGSRGDSEVKRRIESIGCGCVYEEANAGRDAEQLVSYIAEKYRQWRTEGLTTCDYAGEGIELYAYDRLAARLHGIIEDLR